ncbi:MAG: DNA primase [Parcubacteria group bacterium]|jgi:DNA primase
MSSDVEEVKSRINIADLIGEYIRLQKAGSNWRALCPFHNEKTPSFMVSEERNSWHCFGCGKGGDALSFVMEMEGIDFREALEQLAQKAGVELRRIEKGDRERENAKPRLYSILELATKWYEKNLWEGKGREKILKYLRGRGLQEDTIRNFRLGYAPDGWRNTLDFLAGRGYKTEEIAKAGLLVEKNREEENVQTANRYDRFRDRIIFPVQDIMGRVVGFSARVAPGGDEKNAKYVNTPQTELYDKGRILYGLHLAKIEIKKRDEAILVEGNMDVIASHQAGFQNAIAVSGTALTTDQIKIMKRYSENVKMAFDMDSAGQTAAKKSARICLENDLNVRIVLLPRGKDAADVVREDKKIWEKAIGESRGLVEYYFEDIFSRFDSQNPADKKKIAKELLNVIKDISNPIEQSHWLKVLAERLGTEEKILADVLDRSQKKEKKTFFESEEKGEGKASYPGYSLEKKIIGLLAAFPKECRRQTENINSDYFSGIQSKNILLAVLENKEDFNINKVKAGLADYENTKLLDEAIFEVEAEIEMNQTGNQKPLDPGEELKLYGERLKKIRLKEKIIEITQGIRKAEKSGNKEEIKRLMNEFQNLASIIGD